MNRPLLDKLAHTLLYEGYALYPYRPSVKNRQRWNFGGLYPESWSVSQEGSDASLMQTQCLVEGPPAAKLDISIRFLHLVDRTVAELLAPVAELPPDTLPPHRIVEKLEIGGRQFQSWQESVEREIPLPPTEIATLVRDPITHNFSFPYQLEVEPLRGRDEKITAIVIREQQAISGTLSVTAEPLAGNLTRLTVRVLNTTAVQELPHRDHALVRAFLSTHTLLGVTGGQFVSLTDPPEVFRNDAAACKNIGTWPILVGATPERDTLLSSPIILQDYPELAPQSPGDLFDATEIDEILTLRILTLTDAEKRDAAAIDPRIHTLMERTQSLAREQLATLHGMFKPLVPPPPLPEWSPFDTELDLQTHMQEITAPDGRVFKVGDHIRLRPSKKADIFDIALAGRIATIVKIEQDLENRIHLAVTVDDDPGSDIGRDGKIGHRFFFGLEEVEPLDLAQSKEHTP